MAGRLFAVVGPSGAGKDTLMAQVAQRLPALHMVRRVITRPESAGGEAFEGVSEAEFARRRDAGAFVLHWRAHGLSYGIPVEVRAVLAEGRHALFNGSRAMLGAALEQFPDLNIIHVTARREVLAERLQARGREDAGEIERRLARGEIGLPDGIAAIEIDNSGPLEDAVSALMAVLAPAGAEMSDRSPT